LGVSFSVAVTLGGMIGLGILRTPGTVASQLPSVWLILGIWIAGGIYALLGVFSAAELGVAIPRAGGWYSYARRAFGERAGFAVGWMDWVAYPATFAITSITTAEYLAALFPVLRTQISVTAIVILVAVAAVNWIGLRWGSGSQQILSFLKAGVFLALIISAFTIPTSPSVSEPAAATAASSSLAAAIVIALQAVIYTYDGWYSAIYFSEESDDARKIPRSMVISVIAVMAIYVLINGALLHVLSIDQIASSNLPVADLANATFGVFGDRLVTVLAIITLLSLINANILTAPRIIFAMARDGHLSEWMARVNKGGTPANALFLTVGLSIPIIVTSTYETILAVTAFLFILLYVAGFLSMLVLRRTEPDLDRPYRAHGYPWTTFVVLIGSLAFLIAAVITDTLNTFYALLLIILGVPFYYLFKRK
jgi:APA family basic amino acid/polyamine antiporter